MTIEFNWLLGKKIENGSNKKYLFEGLLGTHLETY